MKISEAQSRYRAYQHELITSTNKLENQRDELQKKYEMTGDEKYSEEAATLQLSIDDLNDKSEQNNKVLESLSLQYELAFNAEVARQQADAAQEMGNELGKILTVARRIAKGDKVPYSDEKKLMEYSPKLYQLAKNSQMLNRKRKYKEYESLWDEDKEKEQYDPEGKAQNAEAMGNLPAIEEIEMPEISEE